MTARGPARFPSTIAIHSRPHYPYPHTFRSVVRVQRSASNIRSSDASVVRTIPPHSCEIRVVRAQRSPALTSSACAWQQRGDAAAMSESFLAAAEARFTASAGSTPPPSAVIESLCSSPSALTPAVLATLTPAAVATPTQLAQAPAEVPCDEELPLTLQAYPHLRNTPAAKGWRPPPVMRMRATAPRPYAPLHPVHPFTPVRVLAASRRAAQHIAHGRDGSPRWLPTRYGNGGLRACQCRQPPASASPVEGACCGAPSAGVCQRTLLPPFRSQGSRRPRILRSRRSQGYTYYGEAT